MTRNEAAQALRGARQGMRYGEPIRYIGYLLGRLDAGAESMFEDDREQVRGLSDRLYERLPEDACYRLG